MKPSVYVFDPTQTDKLSSVRGVGRYMQILKENFPEWSFTNNLIIKQFNSSVFINPFFNFFRPPLLMRRIAQRQIAVIHDLIPLKYPSHFPIGIRGKLNVFLNKLALKNYDVIVTDSEASKKDIVKILGINEQKIKVVYPCLPKIFIDAGKWKMGKGIEAGQVPNPNPLSSFCLYVGDATWNKNLVNLARAIKIINVTCVFVGKVFERAVGVASEVTLREADGGIHSRASQERRDHERQNLPRVSHPWQQEFKEFLNETKNDKRFVFLGFVDDYRLLKLYQQTKVNILPSRDEGFGFSYLEAASQGCPSVLSNIPILQEISGEQAFFANPDDPHDIADKIGEIYFNDSLRGKLGSKAKKRSDYFSQERLKKDFSKLWI